MTGSAGKEFYHFDVASVVVEERRAVHDQPVRELLQSEQDERSEPRLIRKQWKTSGRCEEIVRQAGRWSELTGLRSQDRGDLRAIVAQAIVAEAMLFPFVLCVCVPIAIPAIFLCVLDGFQAQKRKGYVAGHVRKEELLASAITIDGRKEWFYRFCSETNVWTRPTCRRCQTGIPSVLQAKHMQAMSTKSGRCWSASSPLGDREDQMLAHEAQWAKGNRDT